MAQTSDIADLVDRTINRIGQDRASAVVWLTGHYPKALLIVVGPAGVTVTGLRWPVYGPGRPARVFAAKAVDVRPPYAAMVGDGLRAVLSAYEGDRDVTIMNTGVFPCQASRRRQELYAVDNYVVQVIPRALRPTEIIV